MSTTGAATAGVVVGDLFALGDLERVTAAARGGRVRILDLEARLLECLEEVDLRAAQVGSAERVDDHGDPVPFPLEVARLRALVESEGVLEARAPTTLDRNAKNRGLALGLFGHEGLDLVGGALRQRDDVALRALDIGLRAFDGCHAARSPWSGGTFLSVATGPSVPVFPLSVAAAKLVTPVSLFFRGFSAVFVQRLQGLITSRLG